MGKNGPVHIIIYKTGENGPAYINVYQLLDKKRENGPAYINVYQLFDTMKEMAQTAILIICLIKGGSDFLNHPLCFNIIACWNETTFIQN